MLSRDFYEAEISSFSKKQEAAAEFINIISKLWFEQTVEIVFFRNQLIDRRISVILNLHNNTEAYTITAINIFDSLAIVQIILDLKLPPSRIDVGKLAMERAEDQVPFYKTREFIIQKLCKAHDFKDFPAKDVVLYGFGRIGRLLARELIAKAGSGKQLRLRAIVTRDLITESNLKKRASLLQLDSIHGDFEGSVETDFKNNALIINGVTVYLISAKSPNEVNYTRYGINDAVIIDNTGAYRTHQDLSLHLESKGASQVLLTAPGKDIPNIVYGVNDNSFSAKQLIISSAASCTTNAIVPILKVIEDNLRIQKGHIETIHSYTNDQNLVDNMHSKFRRGRAAALNMVITETGAGQAVSKAIPSLEGRLTSNAIRVPVPNGSLAILTLEIKNSTNRETLNALIQKAALEGELVEQIKFSVNEELVSSDIIGTSASSIVDSKATIVSPDGQTIILYVWYDNECGYSHQVIRLLKHIAGVRRFVYY